MKGSLLNRIQGLPDLQAMALKMNLLRLFQKMPKLCRNHFAAVAAVVIVVAVVVVSLARGVVVDAAVVS